MKPKKTREMGPYEAYVIWVEPEGDFYFSPEGLCVIAADQTYTVYSLGSRHNFLRAAVLRFPIAQLLGDGVAFRGSQVKLQDLAEFRENKGLVAQPIIALIKALFQDNRERHHYLSHYL